MRLHLIGDVGAVDGVRHVGDEAMLEAVIDQLGRRGEYEMTVVSSHPAETAERYGVEAVPTLGLAGSEDEQARLARVEAVVAAAQGDSEAIAWDDPAWEMIRGVARCDAAIIAGGGNLSSLWQGQVFERLALSRLARTFDKPLYVTGQTLGPTLSNPDGQRVSEILTNARLVGVREQFSHDIAGRLGVAPERLRRTVDDASYLPAPDDGELQEWLPEGAYCLATFSPYAGAVEAAPFVTRLAALLDHVVDFTGLEIVFLPHEGAGEGRAAVDGSMHEAIRQAMTAPSRALGTPSNRVAAELSRRAALSLSSRYHPAVFAAAAGVPSLAISVDEYTDNKLFGALDSFGQSETAFPVASLFANDLEATLDLLWEGRDSAELLNQREALVAFRRQENTSWWDELHASLQGGPATPAGWTERTPIGLLSDELRRRTEGLRDLQRLGSRVAMDGRFAIEGSRRQLELAVQREVALEAEVGQALADLESARAEQRTSEIALQAAQRDIAWTAPPSRVEDARVLRLIEELRAAKNEILHSPVPFRWGRIPRAILRRVKRLVKRIL